MLNVKLICKAGIVGNQSCSIKFKIPGEHSSIVLEHQTPNRDVLGLIPTSVTVLVLEQDTLTLERKYITVFDDFF